MLVDIDLNHSVLIKQRADVIKRLAEMPKIEQSYDELFPSPRQIVRGIYETHLNYNHDIDFMIKSEYPFDISMPQEIHDLHKTDEDKFCELAKAHWDMVANWPHDYGLCDSWPQILEKWPELYTNDRNLIICMTWLEDIRPHKWGSYIGTNDQVEEYEYLSDCPGIDGVWSWHIIEIKEEYVLRS